MPKPSYLVHLSYRTRLTKSPKENPRMLQAFKMPKALIVRTTVLPLAMLGVLCVAPATGLAQQSSAPIQNSSDQNGDDQKPTETLKVNVNVVQLFFNVKDKKGALIPNLTKDDFQIFEDGTPQTVKYFNAETNLPLTLGIMIDSSGSQRNVLDMEKEVGASFLRQILHGKDEALFSSVAIKRSVLQ